MYRRALTVVHGLAQFSVSKLFAALRGAWLEPQSGAMFTDTGGTTAVTTGGQSIARLNDQSGWGNNATQATSANRPTYQLVNNLPLVRHDATDTLTCSLPNLGGGVFSSAGSVYFATPVGMSALHNQSMGTSYNLPALSTDIYSWMVFPQRLSAAQETQLERYMLGKAGLAAPYYFEQVDYGPELVTNGDFSNGTTGWGAERDIVIASISGECQATTSATTRCYFYQIIQVTPGKAYKVTATMRAGTYDGTIEVGFTNQMQYPSVWSTNETSNTTHTMYLTANTTTLNLQFVARTQPTAGLTFFVDNVSVRELKDGVSGYLADDSGNDIILAA